MRKIMDDKEIEYFERSLRAFIHEQLHRFNFKSIEDVVDTMEGALIWFKAHKEKLVMVDEY